MNQSLIPPRIVRGFRLFIFWMPVAFLKVRFDAFLDIACLFMSSAPKDF